MTLYVLRYIVNSLRWKKLFNAGYRELESWKNHRYNKKNVIISGWISSNEKTKKDKISDYDFRYKKTLSKAGHN